MDRTLLTQLWTDFWDKGLWAAPWSKAIADLTPAQAAWKPDPSRKSIWQFVSHVTFWRSYFLDKQAGKALVPDDQINARQFAEASPPTEAAWNDARAALERSHQRVIAATKGEEIAVEKLAPILAHDAYHLGQIMYLRALQGMKPIE